MVYDYYVILNASRKSSLEELRKCYYKLALASHPKRANYPRHPAVLPEPMKAFVEHLPTVSVEEFWLLLGEAYEVLTNDLYRHIHDRYGVYALKNGIHIDDKLEYIPPYRYHGDAMETLKNAISIGSPYGDVSLSDIMASATQIASNRCTNRPKKKGKDIAKLLYVSVNDVYFGAVKKVPFIRHEFIDGDQSRTTVKSLVLDVPVTRGCSVGTVIRLPNAGDRSANAVPADVVFTVADAPDATYERHGCDLHRTHTIDLWQALCGFELPIHTIDGRKFLVAVHDIVDHDYVKVIANEGLPFPNGDCRKGNLCIKFNIAFPKDIDQFIRQLREHKR